MCRSTDVIYWSPLNETSITSNLKSLGVGELNIPVENVRIWVKTQLLKNEILPGSLIHSKSGVVLDLETGYIYLYFLRLPGNIINNLYVGL